MTYRGPTYRGPSGITSRPLPMPGTTPQTVSSEAPAAEGAGTPAWLLPLAFLAGGFLITFALTRRG